jgi:four helix bundle protein
MTEAEMKRRTKEFALRILKLTASLPETSAARIITGQLGRSGTSVGANYRAAYRARSVPDMVSKISIVEEEADESAFWLELVMESGMPPVPKVAALQQEATELAAMMVASRKTLQANSRKSKIENQK